MKKILMLFIAVLIISCNQNNKEKENLVEKPTVQTTDEIEKQENFDWLLGEWKRLNEEEGKETFEYWERSSTTKYSGIGFTIQNGDTIKQENMVLRKVNGQWDLTVKVQDEPDFFTFKGTMHNANEFVCENKEIDFPNQIKYWKNGNKLNAMVSNSEMKIPFEFERR